MDDSFFLFSLHVVTTSNVHSHFFLHRYSIIYFTSFYFFPDLTNIYSFIFSPSGHVLGRIYTLGGLLFCNGELLSFKIFKY